MLAARGAVGRHQKRLSGTRSNDRRTFSLMVHGPEFGTGEEVVVNPECFPDVKVNDLLEISQPDREHHRLVLQVMSLNPVRGKLQISVLKDVAAQFGLDTFHSVMVQKIDPREVTVDFLELNFKDQFVSRADIWRVKVALYGKSVYIGKHVAALGVRAQVEALLSSNQNVMCGVVGADTKMIVRSRSSRLIWLVQMSTEMWEFSPDGELYYEKMLSRLLKVLVGKWTECSVSHSVTIIAFSRSFYDKDQFPEGYDPVAAPFRDPEHQGFGPGCATADAAHGYGPTIHVDPDTGRFYEDFYKVLVMNYTGPDWGHLTSVLKREFTQYHETHRWRTAEDFIPAEYEICNIASPSNPIDYPCPTQTGAGTSVTQGTEYVRWKSLPYGIPSRAVDGNILEAINVTLNIMDKHYMDRDLNRTGQSIFMLTAGSSVFRVNERLVEVTKQRMMDNGVGMDMISLATPPLHVVPLFICRASANTEESPIQASATFDGSRTNLRSSVTRSPSALLLQPVSLQCAVSSENKTSSSEENSPRSFYIVPHWVNVTFLEFDCECATQLASSNASASRQTNKKLMSHRMYTCECQARLNKRFSPLPPFRMFDMTAPTEKLGFPMALANMMKKSLPQREEPVFDNEDANRSPRVGHHESPRRRLSNLSDTISTASPVVSSDQWHLCRSPDFTINPSPRLEGFANTGLSASIMAREALEEYDADVFSPTKWKNAALGDPSTSAQFVDDTDFASASLTGDMMSLISSKMNNRWKSVSSHAAMGSTSLVHSLLSPRNSIVQSRSTTTVSRLPASVSPSLGPSPRDISEIVGDIREVNADDNTQSYQGDASTPPARLQMPRKCPPLIPTNRFAKAPSSTQPTDIAQKEEERPGLEPRSRASFSREVTSRKKEPSLDEIASAQLSRSSKAADRSVKSPPLPPSASAALLPSPMELSGSFKKSFLTGNGMLPGIRRTESDQTSTTPLVGSYHPNAFDHSWSWPHHPSLNEVNPFKYSTDTLEFTAARLTSDRRRWSHLFPVLSHPGGQTAVNVGVTQTHLGPNWKSLTSPAILPLTTDYHPTSKELVTKYTESFYALTLPSTDGDLFPKYKNHDELLIEMICQRLASDFQLVAKEAGAEVDATRSRMLASSTNRGPSGESRDMTSNTTTYHLSMGHRIHQIIYDAEMQAIEVKRYVERTSQGQHNEPVVYRYSLWVDRTQSFHPLQQNFYQYPIPEDNWNSLDHLLCGYHDEMSDMIKYRRIRFTVLPPANVVTGTRADKEAYASRFTKFVDYLQTRVASEHGAQEKIRIKVSLDPLPSPNLKQHVGAFSYKMSCDSMASYTRLKSEDPRNEWLMMHVEDTMHVEKSYHFDVRWLACSGIIVDDFISTIRRKGKQAGLELRRIPEYTSVSFLQIHPLIAPIFLPMPLAIMQNDDREKSLIAELVNRLDFVLDDERLADSKGIGYGLGLGKEDRVSGSYSGVRSGSRPQRRIMSREESEALLLEKWRRRGYKQYMHRQAPVFLRLIHNGLVWIPSYDYDQISTPQQVNDLFTEICNLIQTSTTLHDLVSTCCGSEAA